MMARHKSIFSPEELRFAGDCYDEACIRLVEERMKLDGGVREIVACIVLSLSKTKLSKKDLVDETVRSIAEKCA